MIRPNHYYRISENSCISLTITYVGNLARTIGATKQTRNSSPTTSRSPPYAPGLCDIASACICLGVLAVALTFSHSALAEEESWFGWYEPRGSFVEGGHTRYVPPISNLILNETPYITTESRSLVLHNKIPEDFLTRGGQINIFGNEVRFALTERLGFIATKDGYADLQFDEVLPDEEGLINISVGLKYAVISRPERDEILTLGFEYEIPMASIAPADISLQGDGNGLMDLFITGARAFGKLGFQGSLGANLALDGDHDSSMFHYAVHADYELFPNFYPVVEFNGFTTIDDGNRTPVNFEGIDLVNFGSTDSGTVMTIAGGARYRFNKHIQIGAGYEAPVTDREDIMDWRAYFDLILSF